MKYKVLIVEDNNWWQNFWSEEFGDIINIISALTIEEAEQQFSTNPDINIIAMDGCVPGEELNTEPLVKKFRETFTGPMIAISGSGRYRSQLIKAGCDFKSTKDRLGSCLWEIIEQLKNK